MRSISTRAGFVAVAASVLSVVALVGGPAQAATWAPAATAPIHPGVQTLTASGQCTANFVFTAGGRLFIGQAAHCASLGGETDLDGCTTASRPIGTPVDVLGSDFVTYHGTLAYSSWLAMQAAGETDPSTCLSNDLALVELAVDPATTVNPSVPVWGGPVDISPGAPLGTQVYSYGNSVLRQGLSLLGPKVGLGLGDLDGGWAHGVTMVTPDIPGDSGSPFLDAQGRALGQLTGIEAAVDVPPVRDRVGDMARELAYAQAHGLPLLRLERGTEDFNPSALPLDTTNPLSCLSYLLNQCT